MITHKLHDGPANIILPLHMVVDENDRPVETAYLVQYLEGDKRGEFATVFGNPIDGWFYSTPGFA